MFTLKKSQFQGLFSNLYVSMIRVNVNCTCIIPLETISAFARGNTLSLSILFIGKSPRLDKNCNQGKDESKRMPWPF